jgi:hypothetical protein
MLTDEQDETALLRIQWADAGIYAEGERCVAIEFFSAKSMLFLARLVYVRSNPFLINLFN